MGENFVTFVRANKIAAVATATHCKHTSVLSKFPASCMYNIFFLKSL